MVYRIPKKYLPMQTTIVWFDGIIHSIYIYGDDRIVMKVYQQTNVHYLYISYNNSDIMTVI